MNGELKESWERSGRDLFWGTILATY